MRVASPSDQACGKHRCETAVRSRDRGSEA